MDSWNTPESEYSLPVQASQWLEFPPHYLLFMAKHRSGGIQNNLDVAEIEWSEEARAVNCCGRRDETVTRAEVRHERDEVAGLQGSDRL